MAILSFSFIPLGAVGEGRLVGKEQAEPHAASGTEWERRKSSSEHEQRAGGLMEASRHG